LQLTLIVNDLYAWIEDIFGDLQEWIEQNKDQVSFHLIIIDSTTSLTSFGGILESDSRVAGLFNSLVPGFSTIRDGDCNRMAVVFLYQN
jgi:hypothetical protein